MSPELQPVLDKLESELSSLESQMGGYREQYDHLAEVPLTAADRDEKQRAVESQMDAIKPRLRELREKIDHLRKAVS